MGADQEFLVVVLRAVCVVLAATWLVGALAQRVGQPAVVGEMVAGVLLGPTLLGALSPQLQSVIFPAEVRGVLYVVSTIGLTLYMFLVGAAMDHDAIDVVAIRRSASLAIAGIVPPFLLGAAVAVLLHDVLAVDGQPRWFFAVTIGGALSITAFPMLARILNEEGLAASRIGGLTLLAAAVDDAFAWLLLACVSGLAVTGTINGAGLTLVGSLVFVTVMLTAGRWVFGRLAHRVERHGALRGGTLSAILLIVIFAGWVTDEIGIFSVFGGFIAGLAVPESVTLKRELHDGVAPVVTALMLPFFFAYSGLNTRLDASSLGTLGPAFLLLLAAGFAGKYLGCGVTVRIQGYPWNQALAIGALMNARGLMILIFINIGLANGFLTTEAFSLLALVAVVTTAAATPLCRWSVTGHPFKGSLIGLGHPTPTGRRPRYPRSSALLEED